MRGSSTPKLRFIYALTDPRFSPQVIKYIGCTGRPDTRLDSHLYAAFAADRAEVPLSEKDEWLLDVIRSNAEPGFLILDIVYPTMSWEERERCWIDVHRSTLLNVRAGGVAYTERERKELSESAQKQWADPDFRARAEQRWADPEYRARLSAAIKKKARDDPGYGARISAAKLGHVVSEETRQKLRAVNLGRTHSEDTKQKHRDAMQGFKHTDEARAKISATRKERIAAKLITMPHAAGSAAAAAKISGSMWINDGTQNKRVPQGTPLPLGWSQGRALSARQSEMYSQRRKANNPEN